MNNFFTELFQFLVNIPALERISIVLFILFVLGFSIYYILRIIKKSGLEIPLLGIKIPRENQKEYIIPKRSIFSKNIFLQKKKIGEVGFTKELVVFKFFGNFWNSATIESKELYEIFVSEFHSPDFLSEKDQKKIEAFVFVDQCNIQTKLLAILRSKAEEWAHIYVIASRLQISAQELDLLKEENGGAKNITIVPVSSHT